MRLAPRVWILIGAVSGVALSISGCGSQLGTTAAAVNWQPVTVGSLTVTRSAAGVVPAASVPTVLISVPPADAVDWAVGTEVVDGSSPVDQGRVNRLVNGGDGWYEASAQFPRATDLKPHMAVVVTSTVAHWTHVYRVPAGAILGERGGYFVRIRDHHRVSVRIVGANPMTVAVKGRLHVREAVWVPSTQGARALGQTSLFP